MEKKKDTGSPFLMYKDYPLVRSGNTLYYGNMSDKYVVALQIMDTKPLDEEIPLSGKVAVQLMLTDPEVRAKDRIVKKTEKDGLYNAMDIGEIWLKRALHE